MKASVKAAWVKDLRSGEFEQGMTYLEKVSEDGTHYFCCLGVLCRQAVAAGVIPAPELHHDHYSYLDARYDMDDQIIGEGFNQPTSLPRKVAEWAGFNLNDGDIPLNPEQDHEGMTAMQANDMDGLTFAQIADLVEAFVPADA